MSKLKDYRKLFAWTSIYLIISITFFTANTLAYTYRVSGEDLVNGWRKPDDITIFYVNASANVSIQLDNGDWQQMICEQHSSTSYTCEYFLDRNTLGPTISNVTRKLRQETATPTEYTTTIKVDRLPPKIEKLNITKIGSALKVSYSIKDYSYPGKIGCSGLDYITYAVGPETNTIEFNTTVCEYDGIVIFNESGFYQEDFPISLTAYDRLGQSVTNTTIMTVDFMGPDIQDDWQIEKNGNAMDILSKSPENMQYDVVVFIDEPKLDINKVRGDLSGLHTNPVLKNTLKNKQATCLKESENLYKCTFSSIPIRPASANLQIIVNAYDTSGNYANKTLTKTVTLIDDPGQITYVGPLKEHCTSSLSKCYTATESQMFIAEISPGSNFSALIFGFNTETKVGPCFFQEQENKWQCFYRYTVPNVAQLKVYIPETSRDIYGNKVTYTERNVIVDSVPPKILGNIISNLPSCAVASDTLELTVNVKESMSEILKIYANTSGFTNVDQTNGTCEKTVNDEWACTLSVTGFVSEYQTFTRKVVVEDLAGNKVEKDFKFEVCAEDANAVPNIITKIEQENDILVDRRTASWRPIKTYVPLKITKSTGTIIEMTVDNCKVYDPEDNDAEISVLDSGHYFIDDMMVLYLGYSGAVLPSKEFDINCTINARVRVGQKIYLKPEQESVIITVEPYNNPLGVMDSVVEKKISGQKAALRDLDGEIKWRETINDIAMLFCNLAKLVAKINSLLQTLKSAVYVICTGLASTLIPPLVALAESTWIWYGGVLNWFDENIAQEIWPTSILYGKWYGHILKYTCMLYTCQHYKVSGLYTFSSDAVTGINSLKSKATESRAKDVFDREGQMIDENTFRSTDGTEYKRTIDEKGVETWKGTDGTIMKYDPESKTWSRESGPSKQWLQKRESEILQNKQAAFEKFKTSKPGGVLLPNGDYAVGIEVYRYYPDPIGTGGSWQLYNIDTSLEFSQTELQTMFPNKITFNSDLTANVEGSAYKWKYDPITDKYRLSNGNIITTQTPTNQRPITQTPTRKNTNVIYIAGLDPITVVGKKINYDDFVGTRSSSGSYFYFKDSGGGYHRIGEYLNDKQRFMSGEQIYIMYNMYSVFDTPKLIPYDTGGSNVFKKSIYDITDNNIGDDMHSVSVPPKPDPNSGFSIHLDWSNVDYANQKYFDRNTKFYTALESEDWIINPYRSTHWDGLCFPAVVYNLQKEKQLRCKYLSCLETQASAGMPSYVCDREFGMESCLYLDSAQWHVTGGNFWDNIGPGLLKSSFSFVAGMAPYLAHDIACADYKLRSFKVVSVTELFSFGAKDVFCGLGSGALQINEIIAMGTSDFWSNLYGNSVPKDPAEIKDYCKGVDYSE